MRVKGRVAAAVAVVPFLAIGLHGRVAKALEKATVLVSDDGLARIRRTHCSPELRGHGSAADSPEKSALSHAELVEETKEAGGLLGGLAAVAAAAAAAAAVTAAAAAAVALLRRRGGDPGFVKVLLEERSGLVLARGAGSAHTACWTAPRCCCAMETHARDSLVI